MPDGSILPFYKAPENVGQEKRCDECDGYGHVTDAQKHEWSKQRNGIGAIILPPSLYDAAERAGVDMRYFVKAKPIPQAT